MLNLKQWRIQLEKFFVKMICFILKYIILMQAKWFFQQKWFFEYTKDLKFFWVYTLKTSVLLLHVNHDSNFLGIWSVYFQYTLQP